MERDANELCIFLEGLAPWARPGCLLKEMPKHVRGHALCLCDSHRQRLSDIMYREPVMILTTCSSTRSPNVEFHLHDVLWSRWAGGIHTEVIVMLTQRGMNRQWTATCVSGSLHHWHLQLILTWQGRNDDQEGRSPTAVRTSRDTLWNTWTFWTLGRLDIWTRGTFTAVVRCMGRQTFSLGVGCRCGAGAPVLQVRRWGSGSAGAVLGSQVSPGIPG